MRFRPCIDLHDGVVKQIVGSTLSAEKADGLTTNFVADKPSSWFAELYRKDKLTGGHIIKLGPGNDEAAREALQAWPGKIQLGGGVTAENAQYWIENGASHVIVTSFVFKNGLIDMENLDQLVAAVGAERIVLDLSCRKRGDDYYIVTDRWQKFTDVAITEKVIKDLAGYCAEYLVHAVDVEGRCSGIETELVEKLGRWVSVPTTYAGGIRNFKDIDLIEEKGRGRLDFTVGSALDIFGGTEISYKEIVNYCRKIV